MHLQLPITNSNTWIPCEEIMFSGRHSLQYMVAIVTGHEDPSISADGWTNQTENIASFANTEGKNKVMNKIDFYFD